MHRKNVTQGQLEFIHGGLRNIFIGEEEEEKDTNGKINEFSIREGEEEGSLFKNK